MRLLHCLDIQILQKAVVQGQIQGTITVGALEINGSAHVSSMCTR